MQCSKYDENGYDCIAIIKTISFESYIYHFTSAELNGIDNDDEFEMWTAVEAMAIGFVSAIIDETIEMALVKACRNLKVEKSCLIWVVGEIVK